MIKKEIVPILFFSVKIERVSILSSFKHSKGRDFYVLEIFPTDEQVASLHDILLAYKYF